MNYFKLYITNKEDPDKWNVLITIRAKTRTAALNKICMLMQDEPYLRDLITMANSMEIREF